jgi:hypothetical protein
MDSTILIDGPAVAFSTLGGTPNSPGPSPNPSFIIPGQTLLENFPAAHQSLLETRELINQTSLEKFRADLTQYIFSRPCS